MPGRPRLPRLRYVDPPPLYLPEPEVPRGRLGRGLGALIPDPIIQAEDPIETAVAALPLPDTPGQRWTPRATTVAWLAARRSAHTRRAYFRDLADYLTWLAARDLDPRAARRGDLDVYLAQLRSGPHPPSPATQRRRLAALSSWYAYLADHDLVERNPVAAVTRPPVDPDASPTVGLTVAEARALLRAADEAATRARARTDHWYGDRVQRRNQVLLGVLLGLGLRVGEALRLTVGDVRHNAGHQTLVICGKGERRRELPVPPALGWLLGPYLDDRRRDLLFVLDEERAISALLNGPSLAAAQERAHPLAHLSAPELARGDIDRGLLFATSTDRPLTQGYVFAMLRRLARAADLPAADRISPHSLRHTAATAALDDGATLRDVQDFLGHADPRTTRRYDRNRGALDRSPAHRLAMLYSET